jgi:hypothetical protein
MNEAERLPWRPVAVSPGGGYRPFRSWEKPGCHTAGNKDGPGPLGRIA